MPHVLGGWLHSMSLCLRMSLCHSLSLCHSMSLYQLHPFMVLLSCRCKFKPYTNGFEYTSLSLTHVSEKFTSLSHPSQETILLPLMMIEVGCGHLSVGHSPTEDAEELTDRPNSFGGGASIYSGIIFAASNSRRPWLCFLGAAEWFFDSFNSSQQSYVCPLFRRPLPPLVPRLRIFRLEFTQPRAGATAPLTPLPPLTLKTVDACGRRRAVFSSDAPADRRRRGDRRRRR